jgi:hypothetical protein
LDDKREMAVMKEAHCINSIRFHGWTLLSINPRLSHLGLPQKPSPMPFVLLARFSGLIRHRFSLFLGLTSMGGVMAMRYRTYTLLAENREGGVHGSTHEYHQKQSNSFENMNILHKKDRIVLLRCPMASAAIQSPFFCEYPH